MAVAMAVVGGSWIIVGVLIAMMVGIIYGLYTRTGSGIAQRPYNNRWGDAPGAKGASQISGREGIAAMTTRGTK